MGSQVHVRVLREVRMMLHVLHPARGLHVGAVTQYGDDDLCSSSRSPARRVGGARSGDGRHRHRYRNDRGVLNRVIDRRRARAAADNRIALRGIRQLM